jgi:2-polyprenyl-3-methyl-5-hydroxy-6-metoxy-1,4-benzoquinol methylase
MPEYNVQYDHHKGWFDRLQVEHSGMVRLDGWHSSRNLSDISLPELRVEGEHIPLQHCYHTYRPDVAAALRSDFDYHGFGCLYALPEQYWNKSVVLTLVYAGRTILTVRDTFQVIAPHYGALLNTTQVLHREHIYSFGPPVKAVGPEIAAITQNLQGSTLDFGCGIGVLVSRLRERGIDAHGIEIDREGIRANLPPDIAPFITLYNGELPLPYSDNSFTNATAIDVIEHVPNYEAVLAELARVVSGTFIISVPDMSAIPLNHHNGVVPWHLLEGTHVNFFTQSSLERVLKQYFRTVETARICPVIINNSMWYCNLLSVCRK